MEDEMRNPFKTGTPEHFFWKHAGYSYAPTQTPEEGRRECAAALADAERRGSDAGLAFEWREDDQTDESFRETDEPYRLWVCVCRGSDGEVRASLGGIDFGPKSSPWGDPYRRVVEAELAHEAL